jgi:hypothetical protein
LHGFLQFGGVGDRNPQSFHREIKNPDKFEVLERRAQVCALGSGGRALAIIEDSDGQLLTRALLEIAVVGEHPGEEGGEARARHLFLAARVHVADGQADHAHRANKESESSAESPQIPAHSKQVHPLPTAHGIVTHPGPPATCDGRDTVQGQ